MKKLVMGCAVAGLIALSPKSEAKLPASATSEFALAPLPLVLPRSFCQYGTASWYGEECLGNTTATGELYDINGLTAAHRTLPLGTTVKVTNLRNHRAVLLRVNDRGPSIEARLIDVSKAAAERLGFLRSGLTPVEVRVVQYPKGYRETEPFTPDNN